MTTTPISRRRALLLGGLGTAGIVTGAVGWRASSGAQDRLEPATSGGPLAQPRVLASSDGRLEVELRAAAGVPLLGRDTAALGYDGTTPGPTLQVRPGDTLAVRLVNDLDQPTNLHTHGLRVSPRDNGDNPFVRVAPGEAFDYEFVLPQDHPTGTFWYHPHAHGNVADQVFGGLLGALLVVGDDEPQVAADRVLVVSDTSLDGDGRVVGAGMRDRMSGRTGDLVLCNGQLRPTIPVTSGSTERWRIVNATASRTLPLRLQGHDLLRVALDGGWLREPERTERVVLAPGNRTDVLVTATGAGTADLVVEEQDGGGMMMGGGSTPMVTLATMEVTGSGSPAGATPTIPAAEAVDDGAVDARRELRFGMGMGAGGMTFTIDGRTFDPERDDITVGAGSVEEWTVRNPTMLAHPFHLHVWPFTVVASSTDAPRPGIPQDVVDVPAGGWVRLRIPFTRHTGRSVFHCHILDHEDAGMMATVVVR